MAGVGKSGAWHANISDEEKGAMARKYFGTDGIRGLTNTTPMTAAMAMKVAS
jgi:phosphomannomutase